MNTYQADFDELDATNSRTLERLQALKMQRADFSGILEAMLEANRRALDRRCGSKCRPAETKAAAPSRVVESKPPLSSSPTKSELADKLEFLITKTDATDVAMLSAISGIQERLSALEATR